MRAILSAILVVALHAGAVARAQEITLDSAPPVVVKTVPEAGAGDIDPATTEIRVTFSKDMQDESWSWSTASQDSFPETAGKPKYNDARRICVLPVKLQPGKTYALWLNSQKFRNFKDASGQPAVPYLLVFKTKG
jgi:RNA polymerase sigma-70 factor (ECF subfamily)